jgi:hypothetical protein
MSMNGEINLSLVKAPDDPAINDPTYLESVAAFSKALHSGGAKYSQRGMAFDSAAGGGFPLGE